MKQEFLIIIGAIGGAISSLFGGFTTSLQTLIIFMAIDYITGLIVAGVFKKSTKTESGELNSNAGFKGLIKKGYMLLMVLVAYRLQEVTGFDYIKDTVIIAFIVNEVVSLIENAGLMGVPIPNVLKKAIEVLKTKDDEVKK